MILGNGSIEPAAIWSELGLAPDVYLEDLCFDAQQAAEKAIKALLILRRQTFPYVHDLADLLTLLERAGEPIPASVKEATALSSFAVETCYQNPEEPVTQDEYRRALRLAEETVRWAEALIHP